MTDLFEEVFRVVIVAEQRSLELYRQAALHLDEAGQQIVARLAAKQLQAIEKVMERLPEQERCSVAVEAGETPQLLDAHPGPVLPEVLRLALREKAQALAHYHACLQVLRDPALCEIFQLAAALSKELSAAIAAEYHLAVLRLQRPMLDRRTKRAHIRSWQAMPAPNQHSQLSIFLRDFGRRLP